MRIDSSLPLSICCSGCIPWRVRRRLILATARASQEGPGRDRGGPQGGSSLSSRAEIDVVLADQPEPAVGGPSVGYHQVPIASVRERSRP